MTLPIKTIHLETVDSTNTWAKENHARFDLNALTRITASKQTQGRGRFKRSWISPPNLNLLMTYFFTLPKENCPLHTLSLLLSLSIVKMLETRQVSPQIKWPNDILTRKKKIGGVLCEVIDLDAFYGIVIGAGININTTKEDLAIIDQPATSLLIETGQLTSHDVLLASLDHFFAADLALYQIKGFKPFHSSYEEQLAFKGETVTLKDNGEAWTGTLHTITDEGHLLLLLPGGEMKKVHSGELVN